MTQPRMTRPEFASALARKRALRALTLCATGAGVVFVLLSADPYFARYDPMSMWLARAGAVLGAGLAFFFGAAHDNCPACARPLGLGLVLQFFLNEAGNPGRGHTKAGVRLAYKPCDLEKAAEGS